MNQMHYEALAQQKVNQDMFLKKTHLEYGGHICRRCFDARYRVHLARRNVKETEGTCPCCHEDEILVVDLKFGGCIKLMDRVVI